MTVKNAPFPVLSLTAHWLKVCTILTFKFVKVLGQGESCEKSKNFHFSIFCSNLDFMALIKRGFVIFLRKNVLQNSKFDLCNVPKLDW